MTRVLDTANGIGLPAFYLSRPAGDSDFYGNAVSSLAGRLVAAATSGGVITIGQTVCSGLDLVKWFHQAYFEVDVTVLVINGTFSPLYLAEDATIVHGASSPQAIYPTYGGKTHQIPPALPHPTKPGNFLVGFGLFGYTDNAWNNCCGALKFSAKEDGSGSTPAVAFWVHPSSGDPLAVSVAANLASYGGSAQAFHDSTVGASPQALKGSDSDGQFAISAAIGASGLGAFNNPVNSVIVRIHAPIPDYTIVGGDTLADIAEAFYEDRMVYPQILAANPGKIQDPAVIPAGLTLKMPDLV